MSRPGVTYEDVIQAALTLEQNGETATVDKIRIILGGTGSFSTISKFLQHWRNQIIHGLDKGNHESKVKIVAPDIMKAAVDRIWQDMRHETESEISIIKAEAEQRINDAELKAQSFIVQFDELQTRYNQLNEAFNAERAEKELLLLDIKKLREEHTLLQERSKSLEMRYAEMQSLTSQHLNDLSNAHKKEVLRLEEAIKTQLENYDHFVSTLKEQNENARHQHIAAIDSLKVENNKLIGTLQKLQSQLQAKDIDIEVHQSNLKIMTMERDEAINRLNEENKKWEFFNNKSIVSNDLIKKIHDVPALNILIKKTIEICFDSFDKKFAEMSHSTSLLEKLLANKTKDTHSE